MSVHEFVTKQKLTEFPETEERHYSQRVQHVVKCSCGEWAGKRRYDSPLEGKVDWLEHTVLAVQG